jgi:hypothetical protein
MEPIDEQPEESRDIDPVIRAYMKDVDRTILRENLRLTPEQRLLKLEMAVEDCVELQRAGRDAQARHSARAND